MQNNFLEKNKFGFIKEVSFSDSHKVLAIEHQLFCAKVSLYGGHVLEWQPKNEKPVFWISKATSYTEGSAIRGGIPICWPWFGPHSKGEIKGNHGFARLSQWQLASISINQNEVKLTLVFQGSNKHPLWPEPFKLKQELIFSEHFEQKLSIENLSDHSVQYSAALHSYFCVSSPENISVPMLNNYAFDDKISLKTNQKKNQPNCTGPLDRIYYTNDVAVLEDTAWQREIEITSMNTHQWVLWNPGEKIASQMADIHKKGEQEYVCLEAANTQWCEISAKSKVCIGQQIKLRSLK